VIRAFPFAPLVTRDLLASHLPFLLDARGPLGTLVAHVARASPHHDELAKGNEVLAMFTGPHGYVSPTWYEPAPAVPTWNYCAVHAYGTPHLYDEAATRAYLGRLAQHFDTSYRFESLPEDYAAKMVKAIVAFEIPITRLQGKAKLSQNRSPEDVARVATALEASAAPGDRELARWMRAGGPIDAGGTSGQ
jgi:transcriptional regulator